MQSADPANNNPPPARNWPQIAILLVGFGVVLALLLSPNAASSGNITPQNADQLHEVLHLDVGIPDYSLRQFALSPGGDSLAATSGYNYDLLRLSEGAKQSMNLKKSGGYSPMVFFNHDRPIAAFAAWNNNVSFIDMANGATLQHFDHVTGGFPGQDWAVSPDGEWFVSTDFQVRLNMDNVVTGERRFSILSPKGYSFVAMHQTFSDDQKIVATAMRVGEAGIWDIYLWDARTGAKLKHLKPPDALYIHALAFSHDGTRLAVGGEMIIENRGRAIFQVWDLVTDRLMASWLGGGIAPQKLTFTVDDRYLAAQGYGDVWLWNMNALEAGHAHLFLQGNGSSRLYDSMALSRDGQLLAAGSATRGILIYDVVSGGLVAVLKDHIGHITDLVFSDDGRLLISGSGRTIRFWAIGDYQPPLAAGHLTPVALPTVIMTPTVSASVSTEYRP